MRLWTPSQIATLGDASYLSGISTSALVSAYAAFNGAVYPASYAGIGQALPLELIADTSVGYNRTAAAFIETELQGHAAAL